MVNIVTIDQTGTPEVCWDSILRKTKKIPISHLQCLCCSDLATSRARFTNRAHVYEHGLTLFPAWISNHTLSKVWDGITFLNFNGCTGSNNVNIYVSIEIGLTLFINQLSLGRCGCEVFLCSLTNCPLGDVAVILNVQISNTHRGITSPDTGFLII